MHSTRNAHAHSRQQACSSLLKTKQQFTRVVAHHTATWPTTQQDTHHFPPCLPARARLRLAQPNLAQRRHSTACLTHPHQPWEEERSCDAAAESLEPAGRLGLLTLPRFAPCRSKPLQLKPPIADASGVQRHAGQNTCLARGMACRA